MNLDRAGAVSGEASPAALLRETAERAIGYLESIRDRRVAPSHEAIEGLDALDEPTPDGPSDPREVVAILDRVGSPATVASTGGRYHGFVVGGSLPAAVAANWLATAWDQNAALELLSPVAARLEEVCRRWILDLLRLPSDAAVGFVTGATEASFSALAAARHALLVRAGWDLAERGVFGAPPIRVVMSAQTHSSVRRALRLLGVGRRQCEEVAVARDGSVVPGAMPALDERTLVIVQAGHVDTGSFDPLAEVCDHAERAGAWVHVDGAFGLWAAASPGFRHLVEGCERADSWAVDAHKYLNVPYDSGLVICRDSSAIEAAMEMRAPYLHFSKGRDGSRFTPALSRRARAVDIWAAVKSLGRRGVAGIVERTCRHARRLADTLRPAGFEILNDVVLNQVLVAGASDAQTDEIARRLQAGGECWCATTTWRRRVAIRVSVCSWATTSDDIDRTAAAFIDARDAAARSAHESASRDQAAR